MIHFLQAFAKISSYVNSTIKELHTKNLENYQHVQKYEEVEEVMWNTAAMCKFSVLFYAIISKTIVGLIMAYSIGSSFLGEHYVLPFGYFFPWIDRDTFVGYLINLTYQSTFLVYAYCGVQTTDHLFIYFIMHAIARLETIIIYLRKLNLLVQTQDIQQNGSAISGLLHDVLEKHAKHTEFVQTLPSSRSPNNCVSFRILSDLINVLQKGIYFNFGSLIAQTVFSCYVLATVI